MPEDVRGRGRLLNRSARLLVLLPTILGLAGGSPGCMTRADRPVVGTDSTLVYASKLPTDLNASISFQLKDSALRDEAKRTDRERSREISRLKKERERLLKLGDRQEKQRKLEEKRKAAAEKKAKKAKKGKKTRRGDPVAEPSTPPQVSATSGGAPGAATGGSSAEASDDARIPPASVLRDSLTVVETRLRELSAEDSLSDLAPWKQKRPGGSPFDDRVVETEEGARVQANIALENVYARGKRPLTFHFVWLNPDRKKIFKRLLEYMPNDSTQVLTSSLTISPTKRAPGTYTIQVFLFRELIAEKILELRGTGHEEKEQGGDEAM